MKQIKTFELLEQVKYMSIQELKFALKQHGGSYDWLIEDEDEEIVGYEDRPIIHYESGFLEDPLNVYVNSLYINENGTVIVDMEDKYDNDLSCSVYDLEAGHIRYIMEYMDNSSIDTPEYTEKVNSLIDEFMGSLGKLNQQYLNK